MATSIGEAKEELQLVGTTSTGDRVYIVGGVIDKLGRILEGLIQVVQRIPTSYKADTISVGTSIVEVDLGDTFRTISIINRGPDTVMVKLNDISNNPIKLRRNEDFSFDIEVRKIFFVSEGTSEILYIVGK